MVISCVDTMGISFAPDARNSISDPSAWREIILMNHAASWALSFFDKAFSFDGSVYSHNLPALRVPTCSSDPRTNRISVTTYDALYGVSLSSKPILTLCPCVTSSLASVAAIKFLPYSKPCSAHYTMFFRHSFASLFFTFRKVISFFAVSSAKFIFSDR